MSEQLLNIMLVDDDDIDIMTLQRAFKRNNIQNPLSIAHNGLEALDLLRGTNGVEKVLPSPRIILLDINMPKMNGFEFYKEIRKIDDKVKACFLTAFEVNYTNLKSKYNNLPDPNCVISKPISMDDLVKRVNQIIY
jgi:CheY-like chemotaxis protein